jgi:7-carboxy-7-deazaguanine synthase
MTEPRTYVVKRIFGPTLQGEGALAGTPCTFLRFGGCNMWDGREETRAASACPYCDTDFRGGERMSAKAIAEALLRIRGESRLVVVSGGEPLLQMDEHLASTLVNVGCRLVLETNGTQAMSLSLARYFEHVTMSPKVQRGEVRLRSCDELRVLWPHPNPRITPEAFASFPATHRFVSPINDVARLSPDAMASAVLKVQELGDGWRLSLQLHKLLGVE